MRGSIPDGGTEDEHWESREATKHVRFGTVLECAAEESAGVCSAPGSALAVSTAATLIIPRGGTAE